MDKVEMFHSNQAANLECGPGTQADTRNSMNRDPCFRGTIRKRRIPRRQQFDVMSALAQSTHRQQCLALATAPFPLQIHVKHSHGVRAPLARRSASTSFPSFLNFSHVPRAAIRVAAPHLRLPWENNSCAITVV